MTRVAAPIYTFLSGNYYSCVCFLCLFDFCKVIDHTNPTQSLTSSARLRKKVQLKCKCFPLPFSVITTSLAAKNQSQFLLQTQGAIVGRWREALRQLPTSSGAPVAASSSVCRCHFLEELILIRGHPERLGSSTVAGAHTRSPVVPSEGSGSAAEHRPSS